MPNGFIELFGKRPGPSFTPAQVPGQPSFVATKEPGFFEKLVNTVSGITIDVIKAREKARIARRAGGRQRGVEQIAQERAEAMPAKTATTAVLIAAAVFLAMMFLFKSTFLVSALIAVAVFIGIPLIFKM